MNEAFNQKREARSELPTFVLQVTTEGANQICDL